MVREILNESGIIYRKSRFLKPPKGTYAVYDDDIETFGGDNIVLGYQHQITIELYSPTPDENAEKVLESIITSKGLQWHKQSRFWLKDEELYQTIYEFDYYMKKKQ